MRYGFVGLGQMGYPMAMNLLRKTTPQSTMTIYDVNETSLSRFMDEAKSIQGAPKVSIASTPKDLAEQSVDPRQRINLGYHHHDAPRVGTRLPSL
jgi:3-hydroxyisobutyrate dehydrogenase